MCSSDLLLAWAGFTLEEAAARKEQQEEKEVTHVLGAYAQLS